MKKMLNKNLVNVACTLSLMLLTNAHANSLPIPVIIYPIDEAKMASPMTGILQAIHVKEGAFFKKDASLVSFECQLEIAERNKTQAILEKSQSKYEGYQRLYELKNISKMEFIEAKSDFLESQTNFEIANLKVEKCDLKAPYDGQVIASHAHAFEHIGEGQPLIDIASVNDYEIKVVAPSEWIQSVKIGEPFKVELTESQKILEAKVIRFSHYIDPVSQTFAIYGEFTTSDIIISPGMSGRAIFASHQK